MHQLVRLKFYIVAFSSPAKDRLSPKLKRQINVESFKVCYHLFRQMRYFRIGYSIRNHIRNNIRNKKVRKVYIYFLTFY